MNPFNTCEVFGPVPGTQEALDNEELLAIIILGLG